MKRARFKLSIGRNRSSRCDPARWRRHTHDYVRHGTTTLFAALDVATGQVTGRFYASHRHQEFLQFLKLIARTYRRGQIHLVLDNYHTHKQPKVAEWLAQHPRFHLDFTPTSASWMNQVESWFSLLQRRAIRRGVFRSVGACASPSNASSKPGTMTPFLLLGSRP